MSLILDGTNGLSDVDGSAATPAIRGSDANTGVFFGSDVVGLSTGGSERVRVDASGNVGIGTSSPGVGLSIQGTTADAVTVQLKQNAAGGNDYRITSRDDGSLRFNNDTAGAERMRIDSSGNLLVGTTSALNSTHTFVSAATGTISLRCSGATAGNYYKVGHDASSAFIIYNQSNIGVYLNPGATSWSANSDERLKTALTPFENAAEKVSTLRAGTGRYLSDAEDVSRSFLIAQDVQAVLPEAVDVQTDEQGTLGLRYTDLIPLLTAAIQEQQAIITALTARVEALEGAQA
jgi:hypothetical protein